MLSVLTYATAEKFWRMLTLNLKVLCCLIVASKVKLAIGQVNRQLALLLTTEKHCIMMSLGTRRCCFHFNTIQNLTHEHRDRFLILLVVSGQPVLVNHKNK